MMSIGANNRGDYYATLARQDYYGSALEPEGYWLGKGVGTLGLSGAVSPDALRALFQGNAPGGRPLVQNAGSATRKQALDLTMSADKTISTYWSQADEITQREIEKAHAESVAVVADYLEREAGWTRRGRAGSSKERARLVCAAFEHGSSRAGDPQLHTHLLVLNIGVRADGTTGTLLSRPFFQYKMAAGALYRAEFAFRLRARLGLEVERQGALFRLRGIPEKLCRAFSQRRQRIESEIAARGIVTAAGAAAVTLATRPAKREISRAALRRQWRQTGEHYGFTEREAQRLVHRAGTEKLDPIPLFRAAATQLLASNSFFSERELLRFAAEAAPGTGISGNDLCTGARQFLKSDPEIVQVGEDRYTTKATLAMEADLLNTAARLGQNDRPGVDNATTERAVRTVERELSAGKPDPVRFSPEQRAALKHITGEKGGLKMVAGMAGTGKTTLLKAARLSWEAAGYTVVGAALAGKAARGLQEGAGIQSSTLVRLLMDVDRHWLEKIGHHLWQLGRAARGQKTWGPPQRIVLNRNTVVVVDEAAMVGTAMLADVLTAVERAGAKLVLVGDVGQLQSVDAGGGFRALTQWMKPARLTETIRQRDKWAREAVHAFAEGRAAEALGEYQRRGLAHLADTRYGAMDALIKDWKKQGLDRPEDSLILTGTHAERSVLNRMAQEERRRAGRLGREAIVIAGQRMYVGDRILFTENSQKFAVENGTMGTLTDIDRWRGIVRVRLDGQGRGKFVSIPLKEYAALDLSYAVTTHKSQGVTVERAFVLAGGPMTSREMIYVQLSRARGVTRLYCDRTEAGKDFAPLLAAMMKSRPKELATPTLERPTPGDEIPVMPKPLARTATIDRIARSLRP